MGIYSSLPHAVAPHSWQAWNYPECKQCSQQSAKWWQSDQPVYTCHSVVPMLWATFPVKCCTSLCNVFCKGDKSRGTKKVNSQRPEVNKWRKPGEPPNAHIWEVLTIITYTIMWKPTCAASLFILPHDKERWMSSFATVFFLIKTEKLQSGTEGKSVYVSICYISEMRMQSVQKGRGQKKRKLKK